MATFKKITQSFTEMPDDLDGKHEVIVTIESMSTGVPNITAVMDAVFKDGELVKFKFTDFYDAEGERDMLYPNRHDEDFDEDSMSASSFYGDDWFLQRFVQYYLQWQDTVLNDR